MPRNGIILFLFIFQLSAYVKADYYSARAAFDAGDYETAYELLLPLAEAGDAKAQNFLGFMYHEGKGVKQDNTKALMWYQKAAEQGMANAQYSLGVLYGHKLIDKQDYTKALMWYQKAAEQGFAHAQANLGIMYYEGYGVPKSNIKAYAWLQLAIEGGLEEASTIRKGVGEKMNSKEVEEAHKLVKELKAKTPDEEKFEIKKYIYEKKSEWTGVEAVYFEVPKIRLVSIKSINIKAMAVEIEMLWNQYLFNVSANWNLLKAGNGYIALPIGGGWFIYMNPKIVSNCKKENVFFDPEQGFDLERRELFVTRYKALHQIILKAGLPPPYE